MAFIIYNDKGLKKTFEILEDKMIVFGREDHAEFQILKDSQISREHFAIEKDEDGKFVLIELGASNGTYLNGEKLESNSITKLVHGDEIKAGRQVFTFRVTPLEKETEASITKGVMDDMQNGKGYHTIMCEILGLDEKTKKKKRK
jgi:pSer/pThr/pTyr-binding forkhead associated (FHA) protein